MFRVVHIRSNVYRGHSSCFSDFHFFLRIDIGCFEDSSPSGAPHGRPKGSGTRSCCGRRSGTSMSRAVIAAAENTSPLRMCS